MGVAPGSPVSASNTNQAFLDANADDQALGKIGFANTDPVSGATVDNIQREANANSSFTGLPLNSAKDVVPAWNSNVVGSNTDPLKTRTDLLTGKFDRVSGHGHSGAEGDGGPVQSAYILNVPLEGKYLAAMDLTGVTGDDFDVSSYLSSETPSTSSTIKGIVVNDPYNYVFIFNSDFDLILDGSGNTVFGRLTYATSVWTLSFYSLVAGVETAYTFITPTDLKWKIQKLYDKIVDAPVYSDVSTVPSENATADILDASETVAGKVLLSNVVAQSVGSANVKGVATRVSKEDHAHQGVHSVFKTGGSQIYGDVELSPGTGVTITQVGNKFTIDSVGGVGYQEVPAGPVNGVNDTFGPLSQLPSSIESCIVFVDGFPIDKSLWTLTGYSIIFNSGSEPDLGQDIYVWYLSAGIPAVPPTPTGVLKTEFRTLTAPEIAAKKVVLLNTPSSPGDVLVDVIGGTSQEFNLDYTIVTNELRWNGYGLDAILGTGDKLRVHYLT